MNDTAAYDMNRRTKIVGTIGPSCDDRETLRGMFDAGMDVVRINLSHGSSAKHEQSLRLVEELREQLRAVHRPLSVMLDMRGPEIRLVNLERELEVETDTEVYLTGNKPESRRLAEQEGEVVLQVSLPDLASSVSVGDRVSIDDGQVRFTVQSLCCGLIRMKPDKPGRVLPGKKVSFPDSSIELPFLSAEDEADLSMIARAAPEWLAVSFVRQAGDILQIRDSLADRGGSSQQPIIAKIESSRGYDNLKEILQVADAVMVARGDLGVDCPPEQVPIMQKDIIDRCRRFGTPVITATQMLESMIDSPVATRAEASDAANAILDGTDAVMLSGETAVGKYPVEAVKTIRKIVETTESWQTGRDRSDRHLSNGSSQQPSVTEAVAESAVTSAHRLEADAILAATHSGYTARMVAKYRPSVPVVAVTPHEAVRRQLALVWGIHPTLSSGTKPVAQESRRAAISAGFVSPGDLVVVTSGQPAATARSTNTMQVYRIGRLIMKAHGVGRESASARACIQRGDRFFPDFEPGAILVVSGWNPAIGEVAEEASGIISEAGGLSSPVALIGLEMGIPVLVGAQGATEDIQPGQRIVMDADRQAVWADEPDVVDGSDEAP